MLFDGLREKLLKGGIAPRHVRRYLGELEDHLAELTASEEDAGYNPAEAAIRARALLGPDEELADAMLARPGFKSLTARAPWLVFGFLPPFMVFAAFLVPVLLMIGIAKAGGMSTGHGIDAPLWYQHWVLNLAFASTLLLPGLISALLIWLAIRQRLTTIWPVIGILIILFLGVHWHAEFSAPGHRGGSMQVGLWFFAAPQARLNWHIALAQAVLTLSPMIWWMAWRKRIAR